MSDFLKDQAKAAARILKAANVVIEQIPTKGVDPKSLNTLERAEQIVSAQLNHLRQDAKEFPAQAENLKPQLQKLEQAELALQKATPEGGLKNADFSGLPGIKGTLRELAKYADEALGGTVARANAVAEAKGRGR